MKCSAACNANLCPDDPDMRKRVWYPGEPICIRRPAASPVVKNQRQLALNQHKDEFYTGEMLAELREGLDDPNQHGIDSSLSNSERGQAIEVWLVQNRGSLKSNKIGGKISLPDHREGSA